MPDKKVMTGMFFLSSPRFFCSPKHNNSVAGQHRFSSVVLKSGRAVVCALYM